jgi:hypothetical protein
MWVVKVLGECATYTYKTWGIMRVERSYYK